MRSLACFLFLSLAATGCTKSPKKEPPAPAAGAGKDGGAAAAATSATSTTTEPEKTPPVEGDLPAPPDVAAPPADAEKTPSGLASKVLSPGKGTEKPEAQDQVTVHYTGW